MARTAAGVTVNLTAGTATFIRDLTLADGTVKRFGQSVGGVGSSLGGTRKEMVAASGAIRILEGNAAGASRVVARFLTDTLKLGPALNAAFSTIGAIAFVGVIGKIGEGIYKLVKDMENASEKIKGVFSSANEAIRLTDDELKVANDRLENDIAKLEGKRQNNLKLALDEAALSADKLAGSLEKDIESLYKLLKENKPGFLEELGQAGFGGWKGFVAGLGGGIAAGAEASDAAKASGTPDYHDLAKFFGGETGQGGFTKRLRDIHGEFDNSVDDIRSFTLAPQGKLEAEKKANTKLNQDLIIAYDEGLSYLREAYKHADTAAQKERVEGAAANLTAQIKVSRDQIRQNLIKEVKTGLDITDENNRQERPYDDRIRELQAKLQGTEQTTSTIGQSDAVKALSKANAEYLKIIAEIAKVRERSKAPEDAAKEAQIKQLITTNALTEANNAWDSSLATSVRTTEERVSSLRVLTDAIGKGYIATREANIQTQLAKEFSTEKTAGFDPTKIELARRKREDQLRRELDEQNRQSIAQTADKLNDQIEVELAAAAVQSQGSEAVRQATLAVKAKQLADAKGTDATRAQIQAEIDLEQARQANVSSEAIGKLNEQTIALKALTAATLEGADARRRQEELSRESQLQREGRDNEIPALRENTAAHETLVIAESVDKLARSRQDEISQLSKEIKLIQAQSTEWKSQLPVQIALRDLENQRLEALAKEELRIGTLKSGLNAFFLEMETSAKSAGQILYDALHDAVSKVTDDLAKLLTGHKVSGTQLIKGIGEGILKDVLGSIIHTALGKLGHKLGIAGKREGQTPDSAIYVSIVGAGGGVTFGGARAGKGTPVPADDPNIGVSSTGDSPASTNPAPKSGGAVGILYKLGQVLFGGLTHRAGGGPVSPGQGYLVGERGPEPFFPQISGSILSNASAQRNLAAAPLYSIGNIDARGTDAASVYQNVFSAIKAAHDSAVTTSIQANAQAGARFPAGGMQG